MATLVWHQPACANWFDLVPGPRTSLHNAGLQEDTRLHHASVCHVAQPGSFPLHCQRVIDTHTPVCFAGMNAGIFNPLMVLIPY